MWSQLASLATQVSETVAPVAQEFREALRESDNGDPDELNDDHSVEVTESDTQHPKEEPDDDEKIGMAEPRTIAHSIKLADEVTYGGRNWFASVVNGVKEFREALNESDNEDETVTIDNTNLAASDDASNSSLDGTAVSQQNNIDNEHVVNVVPQEIESEKSVSIYKQQSDELARKDEVTSIWGLVSTVRGAVNEFQDAVIIDETDSRSASVGSQFLEVELSSETANEQIVVNPNAANARNEFLYREEPLSGQQAPTDSECEEEQQARIGQISAEEISESSNSNEQPYEITVSESDNMPHAQKLQNEMSPEASPDSLSKETLQPVHDTPAKHSLENSVEYLGNLPEPQNENQQIFKETMSLPTNIVKDELSSLGKPTVDISNDSREVSDLQDLQATSTQDSLVPLSNSPKFPKTLKQEPESAPTEVQVSLSKADVTHTMQETNSKRRQHPDNQSLKKRYEKLQKELENLQLELVSTKKALDEERHRPNDAGKQKVDMLNQLQLEVDAITRSHDEEKLKFEQEKTLHKTIVDGLQAEIKNLKKAYDDSKSHLRDEQTIRTNLETKISQMEITIKESSAVWEQRLNEEISKTRSNISDRSKIEDIERKAESEHKLRVDLERQLDAMKEQFHQVSESLKKQQALTKTLTDREEAASKDAKERLSFMENKVKEANREADHVRTSFEKYVADLRGEQSKLELELNLARKELERFEKLEADFDLAMQENKRLAQLTQNQANKDDLDRALEEVMLLQSEASRNASIHLQKIQSLETELQATKSDVETLRTENSSGKAELEKLRKALVRMTQELEREETTHRQKVVALRSEMVRSKDESEQLLAKANEKQDELKQELVKTREELVQLQEAGAKTPKSSTSPSLSSHLIDVRLVNQLITAFVKRGRDSGDNGRKEVIETMSRILGWTDDQKQEVLESYSIASSIRSTTTGVVSRGIDLLLSSGAGQDIPAASVSGGQKQQKALTTDAAAKLLEKESFEQVFLNEFLAKEATTERKRSLPPKTLESHPATPLSSRSLSQSNISLAIHQQEGHKLQSPLASPVTPTKIPANSFPVHVENVTKDISIENGQSI